MMKPEGASFAQWELNSIQSDLVGLGGETSNYSFSWVNIHFQFDVLITTVADGMGRVEKNITAKFRAMNERLIEKPDEIVIFTFSLVGS